MSCWHKTTLLRIPVSALGFKYLREWQEFAGKHKEDFQWENGHFCESLSDDYPCDLGWGEIEFYDPDWDLGQRDPEHPDIVPGPFLDYYIRDIYPLNPEYNTYGENDEVSFLDKEQMEYYLPLYRSLFPDITLKDMEAVRKCEFEWYIEDHSFCSEYLFRDWEAFLDFIYEEGYRVSSILWWEHCKKNFQHGYGGYSDPDDREWMYSETWLHEDGFEEKDLADIKAYIRETREHGLILGDKYISHDLVPSFYLADEQTPVCIDIAGSGICKGNSK